VRLLRLANLPLNSHERYGQKRMPINGALTFRNVGFSYPSRLSCPVLRNFNLTIQPGTCTAIVGASGSGKSTLTSLLLRLYDPTSGTITVDSTPLSQLHTPTLRSQMAIVPQNPSLLNASIFANIAYGLPTGTYTASDITAAARQAGIHDFITTLPDTYATPLGDGALLSGGQAQRIAIARALARRPSILLLDEPTSCLDPYSADAVRRAISSLLLPTRPAPATVLLISHDPATIRLLAHRICVVRDGTVVEDGNWDDLMAREGGELRKLLGEN
jgi:ATP-binding cassette subfamily B (MDR/TAP) protein 1